MAGENSREQDNVEESYQVGLSEEQLFSLRVGASYIIKERKTDISMKIMTQLLKMGMKGILITGTIPKKVRQKHGLSESDMDIIWLSNTESGGGAFSPSRLDYEITEKISQFMKGGGKVILLDALDIVELANGFEKSMEFMKTLSDFAAVHEGIFLLSINPSTFTKEKLAKIEWQFDSLSVSLDGKARDESSDAGATRGTDQPAPGGDSAEMRRQVMDLRTKLHTAEEDNAKLAEGIVQVTRELETTKQVLDSKEEEIINMKKEVLELNSELRKTRLSVVETSSNDMEAQAVVFDRRIVNLEEENKKLKEELSRKDGEIRHLELIVRDKDDSLKNKQEMLKSLLTKLTDVEVRIGSQDKKKALEPVQYGPAHAARARKDRDDYCPECNSPLIKIHGVGDSEKAFCENCRKWISKM